MTTVHAQFVGDKAVIPRAEFERLVQLARSSENIELQLHEDDVPILGSVAERLLPLLNLVEMLYQPRAQLLLYRGR